MLKESVPQNRRVMLTEVGKMLSVFMFMMSLIGASGCDRLRSDSAVISPVEFASDPSVSQAVDTGIPLAPDKCLLDENGHRVKGVVRAANATICSSDGTVLKTPKLLDRFYAYAIQDDEIAVGPDPRSAAEGQIKSGSCFVTSTMQWVQFRAETRRLRPPVSGYTSLDDVRSVLMGKEVIAACTETELSSGNNSLRWMPVLKSHMLETQSGEIQVLEIGAWTLQRGSQMSPRETVPSVQSVKEKLQQIDCVIVLDCTGSMKPVWDDIEKELEGILDGLLTSELDARVAVVAYRDKNPRDENAWVTKSTIFFNRDGVKPLKDWVKEQKPGGGADWEEDVFGGLKKALELLSTTGRTGAMQSLILIGDNGGHVKGTDTVLGDDGLAVVKLSNEQGATIDCIRVPYHPAFDGDRELFPRQIEKLSAMTHGTVINLEGEQANNLVARLKQKLKQTHEEALLQLQIATGLAEGRTAAELAGQNNIPAAAMEWRIDRIQKRLGSDPRKLSTAIGDVGVEKIFVVSNQQSMEFGILMRKEEHGALLKVLDHLTTSGIERPESLLELWNKSLAANTGDYDLPLNEILQLNGIPVRSGILSMTLSELLAMPHHGRIALREQVEIKFKRLAGATINLDDYGNLIVPVNAMP